MTCRWHALRDAVKASNLPASDRAVYRARLDHSTYGTAEMPVKFTRTQQAVAREIGITVRQVKRAERHLAEHGWLIVTGTTGPKKTRHYVLALGTDCDCMGRVHEQQRRTPTAATGDMVSPERGTPTGDTSQVNGRFPNEATTRGVKEAEALQDHSPGHWAGGFAGVPACADAVAAVDDLAAEWERENAVRRARHT